MASKITEYLQYFFSDPEILGMAKEQSRTLQEKGTLEKKKSELAKTLAGEIEQKQAIIDSLSRSISSGYEWRNIECIIKLDDPKQGQATVYRTDTGEVAKVRRMTSEEMQLQLDLQGEEENANAAPTKETEVEPEVEGEIVNLASAVEVAGSSAKLKAEKKQRRAKTADSIPSAPGDGEGHGSGILRHLSLDEGGVQATIDVLDEDGVLSWRISVAMPAIFQGGVDWARGQSTEPPLGISQAIVDAAASLDLWTADNGDTDEEKRAYALLSKWAQTAQREALTGGAR